MRNGKNTAVTPNDSLQLIGRVGQMASNTAPQGDRLTMMLGLLLGFGCFFMSWHVVRIGAINVTVSDVAFAGCLVLLAANGRLSPMPLGELTHVWLLGLTLLLAGMLLGSMIHGDPVRWLVVAAQYIFAYLLLPMVLAAQDRTMLRRCLLFYALGVAMSQAIAITASFFLTFDDTSDLLGWDFITGLGRIGAFSGNANWNAACVGFALPILLNAYQHRRIKGWAALLCFVPLVWGLFAAASVTGLAAAGLALLVYFAAGTPAMALRFGLPVILLGGIYLSTGLPLPTTFEQRVGSALTTGNLREAGTFEGRSALAKEAWKAADDTVLIGLGADRFRKVSVQNMPVHVFPLLVLVEGGIWSVIGLALMLATLVGTAVRMLRADRSDAAMALAVLTVFGVFMFAMPHMYARLWIGPLLLAIGVGLTRRENGTVHLSTPRPLARRPRRVTSLRSHIGAA